MTYYDELGVQPTAPRDEIQKAYHRLCRMLHPDHQPDAELRSLAELKMRRLNDIRDVLLDPERRRLYDRSLWHKQQPIISVIAPPEPEPRRSRLVTVGLSALALVLSAALLPILVLWFSGGELPYWRAFNSSSPAPASAAAPQQQPLQQQRGRAASAAPRAVSAPQYVLAAHPPRTASTHPAQSRVAKATLMHPATVRMLPVTQEAQLTRPPVLTGNPDAGRQNPAPPAVQSPPVISSPPPPLSSQAVTPPASTVPPVAGVWVYAPEELNARKKPNLYAPEYIRMQISVRNGLLHGDYSAAYRITDQKLSGTVTFAFDAAAGRELSALPLHARDGSTGIVDLKLEKANVLRVNWRITQFGRSMSLGAGTALLMRAPD